MQPPVSLVLLKQGENEDDSDFVFKCRVRARSSRKRVPIFETIFRHGVEAKRPTLRPKRLHHSTQWAHGTITSDAFGHRALGSGPFRDRYFGWPAFIYLYKRL